MIQAKLEDGRVLNFPDGTEPSIIQQTVKKLLGQAKESIFQSIGESITPTRIGTLGSLKRSADVAATLGSAAVAEPVSGVAGLATLARTGDIEEAGKTIESVRGGITREPSTEEGRAALSGMGQIAEQLPDVSKKIGDYTFELTGSPTLATIAATTPTFVSELLGLKGLQKVKSGTKLMEQGKPTEKLRIELNKQGLDYDLLSDQAKDIIPETIEPGFLTTPKAKIEVEKAIIEDIKAGGKSDALAGLKVVGNEIKPDKVANEAIKQGFRPGLVQSVKVANPVTKDKMRQMTNMMQRIKKQERLGLDFRPSDVVGDSVTKRITFIRDKADQARKQLNVIAKEKLPGQPIDKSGVINTLQESLSDLDVSLVESKAGGRPTPVFKSSLISKDRSSQKAITDLLDLMSEGGQPDALRFHKLKRQLDIMIDFKKKSALGLSDAGKKVLKKVRRSLNDSLRDTNADYARVNDVLSTSLTSLDDLDDAVGTIDVFGKGSNKAIGQKMRALLSKQQGRVKLENAVDTVEETVNTLGGRFDDDVRDLVMFADALDNRFGSTAPTSFAGQITQATEEAARRIQTPLTKTEIIGEGLKKAGKGLEKVRGVNDFNAFESLNSLLMGGK